MRGIKSVLIFFTSTTILFLSVHEAWSATMYRIGAPFSASEKDSLQELGIDYLQMDWTVSQLQDAIALDS